MFTADKRALIKLINSTLGKNYDPETTSFTELKTEFIVPSDYIEDEENDSKDAESSDSSNNIEFVRIIADMIIKLNNDVYHIEIETNAGQTIAIRIIGYSLGYAYNALRNRGVNNKILIELPAPILIQIDPHNHLPERIPIEVRASGSDDMLTYDIKVIKLWEYEVEDLVAQDKYLLLPFILLRHRKSSGTADETKAFASELRKIARAISDLYQSNRISSYLAINLMNITEKFAEYINTGQYSDDSETKKEIETMETTRFLMAQEIEAISIARGRAEGEARGEARGKNEVKQIIKLRFQGMESREIADALDLSVAEVESTLFEVGFNAS